jgi:hypothetical protein
VLTIDGELIIWWPDIGCQLQSANVLGIGSEGARMIDTPSDAVLHPRQGKAWSVDEDRRLYGGFVGGQSTTALASVHERSAGGIRARLVRLGVIDENGVVAEPIPPFAPAKRRQSTSPGVQSVATELDSVRPIFAVRTDDGWVVEINSNQPLSRPFVDRVTAMLNGVLSEGDK